MNDTCILGLANLTQGERKEFHHIGNQLTQ